MTDRTPERVVLTERRGRVLVVTLNRPNVRNAVDREMASVFASAMDRLDNDPDLSVGVLAGAGGYFCAGMDLKAFLRGESPRVEGRGFAGLVEAPPAKPLIAAVDGPALAGGFEIVLAADLVVAAPTATFGLPEVRRGLVAAAGGLTRLPARLPRAVALEMILTGASMTAAQLHPLGLVNRLAAESEVLQEALALAETIAANGPLAVQASKKVVTESPGWPPAEAFERTRRIVMPVFDSNDAREGAAAFTERRTPVWTGS
ncbi:crotonase/enoyl-CoA hydratase family protein [Rhodococcus sp. CSLK01-03]|uniref:Crotonase/enoyl-CoA hydratase family protein n=1 Tax=Rhodococcus indonesiensis TaxID=3055869 RepID=A0ABT7RLC1_9NOCA|nr:crotonase/enoyl-CoA hydratase family protein [Rhodococcus indonesiensis]MDM7488413.1 crotonase/enoyl-CoA hydratase family protein [Rhodococcus indonesiensis]